jgi:hypothetical protein
MTSIDHDAPVIARTAAHVPVEVDRVWALLADIAGWEQVYPEISDVRLDGPPGSGSSFSFRTGPGRIEARVETFEAPEILAFSGKGMGATSRYVFRLYGDDAGTRITAEQSMSGMAVRGLRPMLQSIADTSLADWVAAIAARAGARP